MQDSSYLLGDKKYNYKYFTFLRYFDSFIEKEMKL